MSMFPSGSGMWRVGEGGPVSSWEVGSVDQGEAVLIWCSWSGCDTLSRGCLRRWDGTLSDWWLVVYIMVPTAVGK